MRAISIALTGLCAAALAGGCGGTKTVDTAAVEKGIESQVAIGTSTPSSVKCPTDVESKQGTTFNCSVTFDNNATAKVKVTQGKANQFQYALVPGSVQVPGSEIEKQVEAALAQQGAPDATVNCPDNVIVKVGTYVSCDVKSAGGGATGTVKFTF